MVCLFTHLNILVNQVKKLLIIKNFFVFFFRQRNRLENSQFEEDESERLEEDIG